MPDTTGNSGDGLQDGLHADVPNLANMDNSQVSISTQTDEELMKMSNLRLSSMSPSTALDSDRSVPKDQEQLRSIYTRSDVVFDSMDKLSRDLLTWQELQIDQDMIATMLHQKSPEKLHESDITTITRAELEYQVKMLIPSPFLMAQQIYDALKVHKSVTQAIISDMRLLELRSPQEEDLEDRRSEHEADAKNTDDYLDNLLKTVEAISHSITLQHRKMPSVDLLHGPTSDIMSAKASFKGTEMHLPSQCHGHTQLGHQYLDCKFNTLLPFVLPNSSVFSHHFYFLLNLLQAPISVLFP
ncbi:hypothetical protein KCU60_g15088, partial [Aureobasidium melanogenum]